MEINRTETLNRGLLLLQRVSSFFAFLLIPFLGGNDLPLYFLTIDRFWIETSFILSLIVALFAQYLAGIRSDQRFGRFFLAISPLALMCVISFAYTWNRLSTLNEINFFVWSFGAVFLYLSSDNRDALHEALVVGSLLLVLSAIIQLKILLPGLAQVFTSGKNAEIVREQIAPFGAFLNQNMLGGYFIYTLPLAVYFVAVKKTAVYLFVVAAFTLGVLLSLSRLAMLIGFTGLVTVCALMVKVNPRSLVKLAFSLGCALLLFVILLQGDHRERVSSMRNLLGTKIEKVSTEITTLDKRTAIWRDSFRAFLSKPIVGYGAGTFEYAYRKFYDGGLYTKYAHGSLAKTAVELGSLGLIAFFFYLAMFGRGIAGGLRESSSGYLLVSALSGLLFGFLDFAFDIPAHLVTFFVVTSAFMGQEQASRPIAARKHVLLFLIAALCLSFLFTTRASLSRKLVEEGTLAEEAGMFGNAYLSYKDAIRTMPLSNDGYIRAISILLKSYDSQKDPQYKEQVKLALRYHLGEVERNPDNDSELYFVRGMCRSTLAPGKDACALVSKAISLYPSSGYYIFETARCYERLGDFGEALGVIGSIEPYLGSFKVSANPQGLFVYKVRDLEAEIEFKNGNRERALAIESENLLDGMSGKYAIYHTKAREYLPKEVLIRYLTEKVRFYEEAVNSH
ncbi:MAG TPA: O-antigen ligase family protein [Syntrophorhabdales bacterium]|nr:O-antigen ligase family protein [Syntrophorhabdales bacterium]